MGYPDGGAGIHEFNAKNRLLRCSSLRVPGSRPGFASVKASIKFMYSCPVICVFLVIVSL